MNYLGVFKGKLLSHVLEICVGHADNNVFFCNFRTLGFESVLSNVN